MSYSLVASAVQLRWLKNQFGSFFDRHAKTCSDIKGYIETYKIVVFTLASSKTIIYVTIILKKMQFLKKNPICITLYVLVSSMEHIGSLGLLPFEMCS